MKRLTIILAPLILLSNISYAGNLLEDIKKNQEARKEYMKKIAPRGGKPREHIIDPYREERIKKKDSYYTICKNRKFKSFYEQSECTEKAWNNFTSDYPDRGTQEYGDKFYAKLSEEEGKSKRDELLKQLEWVSSYPKNGNKEVELLIDHLVDEIYYIERYVIKINPRHYEIR